MNRPDGQTEIEIYMDKTKYYTVWNDKMGQSSCSARDVQVRVVALNDLLANLWLQALSKDKKDLRQWIPCRGDYSTTSVAGTYQILPTQFAQCNGQWK